MRSATCIQQVKINGKEEYKVSDFLNLAAKNPIVGGLVLLVLCIPFYFIYEAINKKRRGSGKDKKILQEIAARLLPQASDYTIVFANYWREEREGNWSHIEYFYYCLAYKEWEIVLIPLGKKTKGQFNPGEPMFFNAENLGEINLDVTERFKRLSLTSAIKEIDQPHELIGKDGERIVAFRVDETVESLLDRKECPVNIDQTEEVKKYQQFMSAFAKRINTQ